MTCRPGRHLRAPADVPQVVVTDHQAFFTEEALEEIARTALENAAQLERGEALVTRLA